MGIRENTAAAKGDGDKPKRTAITTRVVVDGRTVIVDVDSFTIRESYVRRQVLEQAGLPADDNLLSAAAAVWVALRREDPDVELDWVLDTMTVGDWRDAEIVEDDDSPSR